MAMPHRIPSNTYTPFLWKAVLALLVAFAGFAHAPGKAFALEIVHAPGTSGGAANPDFSDGCAFHLNRLRHAAPMRTGAKPEGESGFGVVLSLRIPLGVAGKNRTRITPGVLEDGVHGNTSVLALSDYHRCRNDRAMRAFMEE